MKYFEKKPKVPKNFKPLEKQGFKPKASAGARKSKVSFKLPTFAEIKKAIAKYEKQDKKNWAMKNLKAAQEQILDKIKN